MMRFDRFTERAQEAAQRAAEIIQRYGHNQIDTEHILLALIEQPQGVIPQILDNLKVDGNALTERLDYILRTSPKANIFGGGAGQIFITPRVKRIIDLANEEANRLKDEYISTEHIFLAILNERSTPAARLLEGAGVTRERVYEAIQQIRGGQRVTDPQAETRYRTLEKYSRDLTQMAREGKLDPVIGATLKSCVSSRSSPAARRITLCSSVRQGWGKPPLWRDWHRKSLPMMYLKSSPGRR
jgi:ATP-dependent Clp protease ATP-binding subunit ClpC